jgi:hypothetical protein
MAGALVTLTLAACGGGGGIEPPPVERQFVWIAQPTSEPTFETPESAITLAGSSFTPQGSFCNALIGTLAPGYTVTWVNEATGQSGNAEPTLRCFLVVNTTWTTYPIGLAPGANTLRVTAADATGVTGSRALVVTRVPPP